jgi:hypothetical protein
MKISLGEYQKLKIQIDRIRVARFARLWPPAGAQKCPTSGGEVGRVRVLSTDYPWTTDSSPQRHLKAFIGSREGKILGTLTTGKARKWVCDVAGLIPTRVGRGAAPLAHLSSPDS